MDDATVKADLAQNAIPGYASSSAGGLAVVTGGASGMGLAFATKAAQCGMIPVVLDLDTKNFAAVEKDLRAAGALDVMTAQADVSSMADMAKIASQVEARFPPSKFPVSLVFANAGYGGPTLLDGTPEALQKQIDVLTMGVIWTFKAFQQRCLTMQKAPCAWVATSSVAGIMPSGGSYGVGKHGCLAVMESLHSELQGKQADHVKAHVLCPGAVATNFFAGGRSDAQLAPSDPTNKVGAAYAKAMPEMLAKAGQPPSRLADQVWEGIESGRFYIVVDTGGANDRAGTGEASLGTLVSVKERHRRLEAGAPPPHARYNTSIFDEAGARAKEEIAKASQGRSIAPAKSKL